MKWIGQHIYDKIARFRDDVYLEDINTSSSTRVLVIDADGKVGRSTFGDMTGVDLTGGTGIDINSETNTTSGDYSATIAVDVSDFMTNGLDNRVVTATGTDGMNAETNLTFSGSSLSLTGDMSQTGDNYLWTSSTAFKPYFEIKNTNSDANGSIIYFRKDKGIAGADGDDINTIYFTGDNSAQELTSFALIKAEVETALDTDEAGKLRMSVAASNGTSSSLRQALTATGHGTNDTVDIGLGYGATSTTTVAGDLVITGTIANRASQIINLKGYAVLQDDVYDYANPYNTDDEAPFQMDTSYGSGTIDSSTEVNQKNLFRSGGFHVPFACTISTIQTQVTCSNAGNVSIAIVEYRPSDASGDQNDYPRTVYETVVNASDDNNNKVDTVTIATADLDATAVPAGSHIMMMVKGDSTSAGGTTIISTAIGLSW